MENTKRLRLLVLIALVLTHTVNAQTRGVEGERVAVLPLWHEDGLSTGAAVSAAVQTTIQLLLQFLPDYQLVESGAYPADQTALARFVEEQSLDSVIYGWVSQTAEEYTVVLHLYSRERDQIMAVRQVTVTSLLDLFDLTEVLALEILDAYLGREIAFGALRFVPEDELRLGFRVYINNRPLEDNAGLVPRLLAGQHHLRIVELEESGRELEVLDNWVDLAAGEQLTIAFTPYPYAHVIPLIEGPAAALLFSWIGHNGVEHAARVEPGDELLLDGGAYSFTIAQYDDAGRLYPLAATTLLLERGRLHPVALSTWELGRGIEIVIQAVGRSHADLAVIETYLNGKQIAGTVVDVLPMGSHRIEVFQILQDEQLLVHDAVLQNLASENLSVEVPVFPDSKTWLRYRNNRHPLFSWELQFFDGAWIQFGPRYELLRRRLGLALLAGLYSSGPGLSPVLKTKLQWLPFGGGSRLSPIVGGSARVEFVGAEPLYSVGPHAGVSLNTGYRPLQAFYLENELRYVVSYTLHFYYFFSMGMRLR